MITKDEIQELLHSTETFRIERTISTGDMDKFQEAICAFANDLPNSRKNGYLILGAYDNGGNVGGKNGGDNVPSSSQVVPSLSQVLSPVLSPVCPQLTDSLLTKISAVIVALSQQTCSITDLMEQTGEKNKNRFRQNVLRPLVDAGLIELTIPDSPNSPKQKYALTEKGKRLFKVEGQP